MTQYILNVAMKSLINLILAILSFPVLQSFGSEALPLEKPDYDNLSLKEALTLAERSHPQLAEAMARIDAATGRAEQAGTFPNPELIVGAEQIPFESSGSSQEEYVAGIGQTIPFGGKRGKAREAELLEREARYRGLDVVRKNLRKQVHSAFATALYQERAHQTQADLVQGAERAVALTRARVDAGDAVPGDLARIEMELVRSQVELSRVEVLRRNAMLELKLAIGLPEMDIQSLEGELDRTFEVPTVEDLAKSLANHPAIQGADARVRAMEKWIDVAKAGRIPDVKIEALYHRLEATDDNTLDLGVSISLPVFNRNQGRLREARAEAVAAESRRRATAMELNANLREAYANLRSALDIRSVLAEQLLPRSELVLKAAEARYSEGDIHLNELISVRRERASLQMNYLEVLREVMSAWGEVSEF